MTEILVERRGSLGLLTLNRPQALNSLTPGMIDGLADALAAWSTDPDIRQVALRGAGGRGLCAGGDVVGVRRDILEAGGAGAAAFWRAEYALDLTIARYPKPVIALQEGIVLGGGMGISAHASHRVVTENSRLGFPEVVIGFVPDVGASWLVARAPGNLALRVALTAEQSGPADAILLGFADCFVPSARWDDLLARLETEPADVVLASLATDPGPAPAAADREWVDAAFAADRVTTILERLEALPIPAAREGAALLRARAPLALEVTLAAVQRARTMSSLAEVLVQDYRVSRHAAQRPDFVEGVRAQLVDKDRSPRWNPSSLADVSPEAIDEFFRAPADGDLVLPGS